MRSLATRECPRQEKRDKRLDRRVEMGERAEGREGQGAVQEEEEEREIELSTKPSRNIGTAAALMM